MTHVTRRGILAGIGGGLALGLPALARAETAGPPKLADLLAAAPDCEIGFVVLDAASGAVLEKRGETKALPPASVQKTITTLFALERLGSEARLITQVLATGPVAGGKVQGDLILVGGGDPTLDTDAMGDLLSELASKGLRGITGRFLVHAGALPAIERIAEDQPEQAGYNPGISGLQLNFNRVNFEWAAGGKGLDMNARGERFLAPVHVATMAAVAREAPLFTRRDKNGVEAWSVASGALGKAGSRWLPVRHVAPYVADVFVGLAAAQGIKLPKAEMISAVPAGAKRLVARQSAPMAEVLRLMLKYSTNVTAESIGLMASGAGDLRGSAREMQEWAAARLGLQATFVDHSGLGPESRVAPLALAQALRWADRSPGGAGLRAILRDVGLRDDKGAPVKDAPVKVRAKSGTLNFVSGLAGFIEVPGGRDLVFATFLADLPRRAAVPMEDREAPPGLRGWLGRAHGLQHGLVRRWVQVYGQG